MPQSKTPEKFAKYWRRWVSLYEKFLLDKRSYTISYENFCRKPEKEISMIMDKLGLESEKNQMKGKEKSKYSEGSGEGTHKRLFEPIKPTSVGRWKHEMEYADVRHFEQIAGKTLDKFGYERFT
ncbi:hypothetical protein GGP66_000206 [Salinibacter ruber]|nr:hypothetical protein [Salinibacter ruber]